LTNKGSNETFTMQVPGRLKNGFILTPAGTKAAGGICKAIVQA
jgi:hypothetical protein